MTVERVNPSEIRNDVSCGQQEAVEAAVFGALGVGLCTMDADLIVRDWNDVLCRWGIGKEEVVGLRFLELVSRLAPHVGDEERQRVHAAAREAVAGKAAMLKEEAAPIFPHPVTDRVRVVVAPMSRNGEPGAALFFVPGGDAARVRAHYERILDSCTDGIMVIDANRRVRLFNRACGELLGREAAEVIKTNCVCGDVVHCHLEDGTTLSKELCPAHSLFDGTTPNRVQEMLTTNEHGEERWIETHYSAIPGRDGGVEFVIGIMRDVHDRKLLEQRLAQSEKLAALGQLTAGIAHEIKNPLGVILSSVEIILDERRPCEMRREAATFIKEEVQRLDQRIRAFLMFARPTPARPEAVVLNSLVRRTVQGFGAVWPNLQFDLQLAQPEPIVHIDPDHFAQMLTNLVLNAAQALKEKGTIRVTTTSCGQGVKVTVEDNGPGVPEEIRKTIFDPFFTTKADGTGLGLAIVCQLANVNGGTVSLNPSELGGAKFALCLPHTPAARRA